MDYQRTTLLCSSQCKFLAFSDEHHHESTLHDYLNANQFKLSCYHLVKLFKALQMEPSNYSIGINCLESPFL